jgi:acetyl esterase
VIVAGDSAGGTLCAALCLRQRRMGKAMPIGQVLIYPALHADAGRAAGTWRATVPMLTTADMLEYRRLYTGRSVMQTTDDPELAPLAALDFRFLPEAAVFAADIDPLAEDSADYVAALRAAGVPATLDEGRGLTHGYVRGRYDGARMAQAFAAIAGAVRRMAQGRTQGRG